jgi:hypothetical protein
MKLNLSIKSLASFKTLAMAAGLACLSAGVAHAKDLPNLFIIEEESSIQFVGCDKREPLFKGIIAVKNDGGGRAKRLVVTPLLAVYVPTALDIKHEVRWLNSFAPGEIQTKNFAAGKGTVKRGRNFTPQVTRIKNFDAKSVKFQQKALYVLGYGPKDFDGVKGPITRGAIKKFQKDLGNKRTGTLSRVETYTLVRRASQGLIDEGIFKTEVKDNPVTVYAVVDPYNKIKEIDETDNIMVRKFNINCE